MSPFVDLAKENLLECLHAFDALAKDQIIMSVKGQMFSLKATIREAIQYLEEGSD